jgi:hypothetical protein
MKLICELYRKFPNNTKSILYGKCNEKLTPTTTYKTINNVKIDQISPAQTQEDLV